MPSKSALGSILACIAVVGVILAAFASARGYERQSRRSRDSINPSVAVATVQRFLQAHKAHDSRTMYGLLAEESRGRIPYQQYRNGHALQAMATTRPRLSDAAAALGVLFLDVNDVRRYAFRVGGSDPNNPGVVRLWANAPGALSPLMVRVYVVMDTDGHIRLSADQSIYAADPALAVRVSKVRADACEMNVKQLMLAMEQYEQDYDGRMPSAGKWMDQLTPYTRSTVLFQDPADTPSRRWSYAFNRSLSNKLASSISSPARTVVIFDSNLHVKNASDTGQSLPRPGRHGGANVFGFVDGSVKLIPDRERPRFR